MTKRQIGTYEVTVDGYSSILYSARSRAKANWRCYQDYREVSSMPFVEFLAISKCRRVKHPEGIGKRILVCGEPATTVIGRSPNGIYFMRDYSDAIMTAHPTEISSFVAIDDSVT